MSLSPGRVKLNTYYMPNKIKIYLAPKEKRESYFCKLKSHHYEEKQGLLKGKRFNCVYKGHFNVFEAPVLHSNIALSMAHQPCLWKWRQLQLGAWLVHVSRCISYFSLHQTDGTKITNHCFAIKEWKYKITEIRHFKPGLFFFLILFNVFQMVKDLCVHYRICL